jgi:hypothetical protein
MFHYVIGYYFELNKKEKIIQYSCTSIVHYDIQPRTYRNIFSVGGASREQKPVANSGHADDANTSSEGQSSVMQGKHKYCVVQG